MFDASGSAAFPTDGNLNILAGFLNCSVANFFLEAINPTLNFQAWNIGALPVAQLSNEADVDDLVSSATSIAKTDWDNFETSWDFQTHPLLRTAHPRLQNAFNDWQRGAADAFAELKRLEEENNRYWIAAYGLGDELTPDVPDAQITVRRADLVRDVKSLLSYAVGCLMGRYSLSQPGLQFAGGTFERSHFTGDFLPDDDGILPITDEAYFEDDIVTGLEAFLKAAYGADDLQANLTFIADALKRKADETPRERLRRYFLDEFISDHIYPDV